MHIKTFIPLVGLLILNHQYLLAQDETIKLKEKLSDVITNVNYEIDHIDKLDDGSYVNLKENTIYKLDQQMSLVKTVKLPDSYLKNKIDYIGLFVLDNKVITIIQLEDKKNSLKQLYYATINRETMEWDGNPTKLAEVKLLSERNTYSENFKCSKSKNNNFLLIVGFDDAKLTSGAYSPTGSSIGDLKTGIRTFSFWVLNKELTLVHSKLNHTIESEKADLTFKEILCDNSGNVAISVFDDKTIKSNIINKDKVEKTDLTYRVLYFKNGDKNFEFQTPKEVYLTKMHISFAPDGSSLDLVGVTLDGGNGDRLATGLYIQRLDSISLKSTFSNLIPFNPADFLTNAEMKNRKPNDLFSIQSINNIIGIVHSKEGNVGVVLEKRWSLYDLENERRTYQLLDLVVYSNLNIESEEMSPLIIKRDKFSAIEIKKGAMVVDNNGKWYLWSEVYVYRINSDDLTYSTFQMFNTSAEDNELYDNFLKKYPKIFMQIPASRSINNNELVASTYVNKKRHIKNLSIKLK